MVCMPVVMFILFMCFGHFFMLYQMDIFAEFKKTLKKHLDF